MPVRVASDRDRPAIERFNRRLAAGGRPERLPLPDREARVDDDRPWKTVHIGVDREGEVRAGIQLVHERFFVRGEERWGAWAQMPLSEGVVDRRHGLVAFQVFRALTRQYPLAVGVGVGGPDEIAARFLIKCGCRCAEVPFVYLPLRPRRMVRELRSVRRNRVLWLALRGATWTGAPKLALGTQRWWMRRRHRVPPVQTSVESGFGQWATDTYEAALEHYGAVACRDAAALERRYGASDDRWVRLRMRAADSSDVGWAVVAPMQMREHRYFGNLRVGVIVDAFSRPGQEGAVLAGAADVLGTYDVDVIVANWSSTRWLSAAAAVGFRSGPSNYYAFAAPTATPLLTELTVSDMHITRGDSDGMVNLKGAPLQP